MTGQHSLAAHSALRTESVPQFVDAEEFCKLAISVKKLSRSDDAEAALRGLLEEDTGVRYVIEERRLFEHYRKLARQKG
jgi:hypothetical protein